MHAAIFQYAFLFNASASDLGLDEPRFMATSGCDPPTVRSAGFANSAEMLQHLMNRCPSCFHGEKLLCWANESFAMVDGIAYDRLPDLRCRQGRLPFVQAENYTSITFTGPHSETFFRGPNSTHLASGGGENAFPMHTTWNLYYELADGEPPGNLTQRYCGEMLIHNESEPEEQVLSR